MSAWTLLNTRPAQQAQGLQQALAQAGFSGVLCPALSIETQPMPSLHWSRFSVAVFVSRNAVTAFAQHTLPAHWPGKIRLVAVGEATADAIKQQGWSNLEPLPSTFDSEGMLSLPVFAQPQGLQVVVIRGDGGRAHLADSLTQAGAQVVFCEVYKRVAAPFCHQAWLRFRQALQPVLLFTSISSLTAFLNGLTQDDQAWCFAQTVLVFSERIAQAARDAGFNGKILVTATSSDEAIIQTLRKLG